MKNSIVLVFGSLASLVLVGAEAEAASGSGSLPRGFGCSAAGQVPFAGRCFSCPAGKTPRVTRLGPICVDRAWKASCPSGYSKQQSTAGVRCAASDEASPSSSKRCQAGERWVTWRCPKGALCPPKGSLGHCVPASSAGKKCKTGEEWRPWTCSKGARCTPLPAGGSCVPAASPARR